MLVLPNSTDFFARTQAGGKGYNLYLMTKLGLPVPQWATISRLIFERFLDESGIRTPLQTAVSRFAEGNATAAETAREIRHIFLGAAMPDTTSQLIAKAYEIASQGGTSLVSIRSSAADEDSARHSFAGQLSSFLYVESFADALRLVRECWASGYSERALTYRRENNLSFQSIAIAVIIQRMIDPDASGVMFTCDPAEKRIDRFVISAVYGVGEGLVSGALDADTFWLDAQSGDIQKQEIAAKHFAFRRGKEGSCSQIAVDPSLQNQPCIGREALRALHKLGRDLSNFYHQPQDIEWAWAGGKVYLLQTRPVTTLDENLTGFPNLWDNSNIVESYGGITSPLSFTFALHNYKNVYIQFCEILGVPAHIVREMEHYLGNMLGCINGRVFYNLYNWYKLVGVLPGFRHNREFMETMMGVHESLSAEIADRIRPHPSWETPIGRLRQVRVGLAFLIYHFRIQSMVNRFLRDFQKDYEHYRRQDYRRMTSDEILNWYIDLDRRMLSRWKAPIINDFLCMVHFGLLRKLTAQWLSGLDSNIHNDLLAGEGGLESAEPSRQLIQLAGEAASQPELRKLIEETPAELLFETLNQSPYRAFFEKVVQYMDRFGFRCMNEMKLEETDLLTDPTFLFVCLKNYLRSGTTDPVVWDQRERQLRTQAEKKVRGTLHGIRRWIYLWSLKHARRAIRNRENTRFARTRVYGVVRQMFRAMGENLCANGILDHGEDIFFLTREELFGIHQGTLTAYNVRELVKLRKAEYAKFEHLEPKNRFLTRGPVYWRNRFLTEVMTDDVPKNADYDLKGLPCCPGVVEGTARVIKSPRDNLVLNGEILVAARTDPGWVPLYPSISGLLVERGSLLSHSAIVAREMGIPAIVSVKGLLATIKDGQRIRMDGSSGTIKLLD